MNWRVSLYGWFDLIQTVAVVVFISILLDGFWSVLICVFCLFAMLGMAENKGALKAKGDPGKFFEAIQ